MLISAKLDFHFDFMTDESKLCDAYIRSAVLLIYSC